MAGKRKTETSSLYLPLFGQEQASRLEEKYSCYMDSDDESDAVCSTNKAPQCNLETNNSSEWFNTQTGTSAAGGRGKQRLPNKKKRPDSSGRPQLANKQQLHEQSSHLQRSTHEKKESVGSDKELEEDIRRKDDVSRFSTGSTTETHMIEESNNENQSEDCWGMSVNETERPKLAIMPLSDKVELRLSTDDLQPPVVVPATINQYLRDYQREGIQFLYQHYNAKTGAILGDDMGLGKTIQVIGFLSALLGKQGNRLDTVHSIPKFIRQMSDDIPNSPPKRACRPFLIIGPSAVMYNWLDELKTWGYFTASKFHGMDKDVCLENLQKQKLEIVVTTFETFRDNIARLNQVEWEAVIVDEVHKIKGLKAQVTQALRTINTPCRFGLTGTALQNNMMDLWSLFDWARPGVLGTLEQFENNFVQVIELGQRHDATKRELAQARKQRDKFSEIRKRMLLRRTKSLLANQLPSKEDLVVMCRLSELQISVYRSILTHPDMKLVLCAEDPCDCRSRKTRASCCYKYSSNGTKAWSLVFSFMHLMLKAANHLALLIPDKNTKEKQASLAKSVCEIAFKEYPQFIEQTEIAAFRTLSDPKYCGKMKVLQGLLNAFYANRDKVLIFSYSTRLLDIIEQYVIGQGHSYSRIDGKVSSRRRQDIVMQFNSESSIFLCLISTKSGGLGLNLTGANKVVIFDPNWNPSHDLQAQDRAYRIGQTRDVKVFRLVSAGTIEENIYLRQIYKQQLDEVAIGTANARRYFHGIQGDKGNRGELFGIKNMFSLRTDNSCLTMDILKRNDKLERDLAGYDITHYVPPNVPTTDSSGSDEENSDTDNRSLLDSDVEEEDDAEFLRELFGSEKSSIIIEAPQNANQCTAEVPLNDSYQSSVKSLNILRKTVKNVESDSDDGEFSLIPKLHKKGQHLACSTNKSGFSAFNMSTSLPQDIDQDNAPLPNDKDGNMFSMSDITFSSKTCATSDALLLHQEPKNVEIRKRGAVSGISWLFSDSDDDDDEENEKQVIKTEDLDTKKISADLRSKKCRNSVSTKLFPEDLTNSNLNVNESIKQAPQKIPPEKQQGVAKSETTVARKSCAAKEYTSLEQLVLKSSDVLHTHVNAQIVGSSRAEDHMTHCAIQDVFELHTNSQAPALQCDPYSQDEDLAPAKKKSNRGRNKPQDDHNTVKCISSGSFKILVGQTPASIKRQQWSEFCKFFKMDQLTLAETLLAADVEKRLSMLKEFYSQKHQQLAEVMAQLFTLAQTDQVLDKDQELKRNKPSYKTKPISSVQTDKNSTTDHQAFSEHNKRKCISGRSHPSLRSNKKKLRPTVASELLDMSCLSPQSEDSITTLPAENQDSSSDSTPDNFLPVPPTSSRKSRSTTKVSLSRSRTRLRHNGKAYSGWAKEKKDKYLSFDKPGGSNIDVNQYRVGNTSLDIAASNIDYNTGTLTENKILVKTDEDITSLLPDMEKTNSIRLENKKHCQNSSKCNETCECHIVCEQNACPSSYISLGTTAIDRPKDSLATEETFSKYRPDTTKKTLNSGERNFACILDDIFSSPEKPIEKQKSYINPELNGERKYPYERLKVKPVATVLKERHHDQSSVSRKSTRDSHIPETGSVFDDLLWTSTVKDESEYSLVRSSKRRNLREKAAKADFDSKGRLEMNKEIKTGIDVDDLNWCKFDTDIASSKPECGSESLFS